MAYHWPLDRLSGYLSHSSSASARVSGAPVSAGSWLSVGAGEAVSSTEEVSSGSSVGMGEAVCSGVPAGFALSGGSGCPVSPAGCVRHPASSTSSNMVSKAARFLMPNPPHSG